MIQGLFRWFGAKQPQPAPTIAPAPTPALRKPAFRVSPEAVAHSRVQRKKAADVNPFKPAQHPKGVAPAGLAMDDAFGATFGADFGWSAGGYQELGLAGEGLFFLGYPYLTELAQRPEYRRISETIATEMTRKWIRVSATGEDDKTDRIAAINAALERYQVRDKFREIAEQDGFFGRSHLYVDLGASFDDAVELRTPISGNAARTKIAKNSLKGFRTVEAVWCYPQGYNTSNPLGSDWYKPQVWTVLGRPVHGSRLLTFVGREVPDLLKPAYSFGGLSMSQMAKPYVDNWLNTRQSVADLISSFSVSGVKINMADSLAADTTGADLDARIALFANYRDNRNVMMLNKATASDPAEEFFNVSTPLGTLDVLQAQTQEHMAAVSGIPLIKLLGISPAGLNASSEGEIRTFYDMIHSYQERFYRPNLQSVLDIIQLSEFGDIDPDIHFSFEPLWSLDDKELAEVRKIEADTDVVLVEGGILLPEEARKRIAGDPDTVYQGLDLTVDLAPPPGEGEDLPDVPQPETGSETVPEDDTQAEDAQFNEADHPRADNGQFGQGSGGSAKAGPSGQKANSVAQASVAKMSGKLTEQQHVDLKDYKEGGYKDLNAYLRGGQTRPGLAAEFDKTAKRMDAAIAKSKLQKDTALYRGIQHPALAANAERLIGRDVDIASFQSTSTDPRVAADFAGQSSGAVVFHINAKAGTSALGMDQFETSGNSGENEVLLGRGSKLRITGVDRSGRVPVIKAEIVSASETGRQAHDSAWRRIAVDADADGSRFVIGPEEAEEIFGAELAR